MRYIIDTDEGSVGKQILKFEKQKKLVVIEKGFPVAEMKAQLQKVESALNILKKTGISEEVMEIYISKKTAIGMTSVRAMLGSQKEFFRAMGVKI